MGEFQIRFFFLIPYSSFLFGCWLYFVIRTSPNFAKPGNYSVAMS